MSKLACRCGNTISDSAYPCPTEGELTSQRDSERLYSESTQAIGAFVAALQTGQRDTWIRNFFLSGYPTHASNEAVISDIVSHFETKYRKSVAECDRCGRLWVQMHPGENQYRSYAPDEEGYAEILRGASKEFSSGSPNS